MQNITWESEFPIPLIFSSCVPIFSLQFSYISVIFLLAMPLEIEEKLNWRETIPRYISTLASFVPANVYVCMRKLTVSACAIVLSKSESGNQWRMSCLAYRNSRNVLNYFREENRDARFENVYYIYKQKYIYMSINRYDKNILFV